MKIFFGILTVMLLVLTFAEKNDNKRKHLTWGFITTSVLCAALDIISMFI